MAAILDATGYLGKVSGKRFLDPACGSGTFIVEALNRYLKHSENRAAKHGWAGILDELCHEPRIVGFDINPFACLMSQIRFMMAIVPHYRSAKNEDPDFRIDTLPIFRTDSLVIETKEWAGKVHMGLEGAGVVPFEMRLPVRKGTKPTEFLKVSFEVPRPIDGPLTGLIESSEEYYASLRLMFRSIKQHARLDQSEMSAADLEVSLLEALGERARPVAEVLTPYARHILGVIKSLKEEYDDGRLVKSLEDLVLAGILKNFVKYDVIAANPPYVSVLRVTEDDRKYYLQHYDLATGRINLYILFYEMGLNALGAGGTLGYISPAAWEVYTYGKPLRNLIREPYGLVQVIDLANAPSVFGQDVATAIFVISRGAPDLKSPSPHPHAVVFKKDNPSALPTLKRALDRNGEETTTSDFNAYRMGPRGVKGLDIGLISAQIGRRTEKILEKIDSASKPLWELTFQVEQCIRIGSKELRRKLLLDTAQFLSAPSAVKKRCRRLIDGADVQPFQINWHGYYLDYRPHDLYNPKTAQLFEQPKLLFRNTSKRLAIAVDRDHYYALNTLYALVPGKDTASAQIPLEFVLGILSSDLAEFIYRAYFWGLRIPGGSMKYREVLRYLRLPPWDQKDTRCREVASAARRLTNQRNLAAKVANFPFVYLDGRQGDAKTISWIQKDDVYVSSSPVQPDLSGDYIIRLGKTSVELPSWTSEAHARYVDQALLGKRLKKGRAVNLPIPKSPAVASELLKLREADNLSLGKGSSVESLVETIDNLAYELFDVSPHKEFIRGFHADFTPSRDWSVATSAEDEDSEQGED